MSDTDQQTPVTIPESDLPESMREINETLGMDATMKLLQSFSGIRLFIPKKVPEDHLLCKNLGVELAQRISKAYGGETITVPRAARALRSMRNKELTARYDAGTSVRTLAGEYRLTERQIYTILSGTTL